MPETYRTTRNAPRALRNALAFNSRDWGLNKTDAWLYGIILGWDDDTPGSTEDAMSEMAAQHGWDAYDVETLRALHRHFETFGEQEPEA